MKLSIKSNKKLQKFYLEDLQKQKHNVALDSEIALPDGWYELNVCYVDTKINISDILINDISIKHILYTGYYIDGQGKIHQPATAVWDRNGCFKIWLHTNIGVLFQRTYDSIRNGDYGKNLFEKYVLTVDRPIEISHRFDSDIQSFFATGDGPNWWPKNNDKTPWLPVELQDINRDKLLEELDKVLPFEVTKKDGRTRKGLKETYMPALPFVEIDSLNSDLVKKFLKQIGYKRIIDMGVQTLQPGKSIRIHRDDHYDSDAYPYIRGCKKFYWTIKNSENVFFKLGKSGLLPLEKPLLTNTIEHTHSVVHQGHKPRITILIYGEM